MKSLSIVPTLSEFDSAEFGETVAEVREMLEKGEIKAINLICPKKVPVRYYWVEFPKGSIFTKLPLAIYCYRKLDSANAEPCWGLKGATSVLQIRLCLDPKTYVRQEGDPDEIVFAPDGYLPYYGHDEYTAMKLERESEDDARKMAIGETGNWGRV